MTTTKLSTKIWLGIIAAILSAALLLSYLFTPASAANKVVSPGNTSGWMFVQETDSGTGAFVNGPETPPMGTGSAQLTVNDSGRMLLLSNAHASTSLSSITALSYSTYKESGAAALAPSLQLDIDTDATDANTAWQGRLVYEPYFTHTVMDDTWQTWNTMDNASGGNWWFSGAPGNSVCPQSNPCTWSEVVAGFPNAAIRQNGNVNFKAGGPWTGGFTGNIDAFTIGINGTNTDYDFEMTDVDTTAPAAPMHVSPANNSTLTSEQWTKADWTDVMDATSTATSTVMYYYESSNSSSTTADGSFSNPAYQSGPLTMSEISTAGTPEGIWYWHVRAVDSAGNSSAWTMPWKVIVDNTPDTNPGPGNENGPKNADECKKGGWTKFTNPSFKNQGQCVSSVKSNR
jgi:hypothetical protein